MDTESSETKETNVNNKFENSIDSLLSDKKININSQVKINEIILEKNDKITKTDNINHIDSEKLLKEMSLQIEKLTNIVNDLQSKVNVSNETLKNLDINNTCSPKKSMTKSNEKKKKKFSLLGEIIFYIVIIGLIIGAFLIRSNSEGQPISIANYSMFTVLTSSMESEIPKGSLVITKNVDPETLKIGDDITYMSNQTTTITHRIISIVEEYKNTGKRAFETQGIMNTKPDKNLVPAVNVVGKVIFHNKPLGLIANYISKNWPFIIFVLIVVSILINFLKKRKID